MHPTIYGNSRSHSWHNTGMQSLCVVGIYINNCVLHYQEGQQEDRELETHTTPEETAEENLKEAEKKDSEKDSFQDTEDLLSEMKALENCDSYGCTRPRQKHLGIKTITTRSKAKNTV